MMPAVFLGSFSGLYISATLPEPVITIVLTLILIHSTMNTYHKTVALLKKESRERQNYQQLAAETINPALRELVATEKLLR